MNRFTSFIFLAAMAPALVCHAGAHARTSAETPEARLDRYNVTWTSPSRDSSGSMPLGNGDLGLNLWVEDDGDLLFYLSKTDAWSGMGRLLKLGRVRVSLDPNPFRAGLPFRQTLRLREGDIRIVAGPDNQPITLHVWVDASRPVVHIEAEGAGELTMQVKLEVWRSQPRELSGQERDSAYGMAYGMTGSPKPLVVEADTIIPPRENRVTWFHRNQTSCYPITLEVQGLGDLVDRFADPLLHRTFGGCIAGKGLVPVDKQTLRSAQPARRQHAAIYLLTARTETPEAWIEQLDKLVEAARAVTLDQAREEHRRWWAGFWDRGWIFADTPRLPQASESITVNELPLRIGADSEGQSRFHGRVARASVVRRALGDAEAAQLAKVGRDQPLGGIEGLVASWRLGQTTDGVFPNAAGEAFPAKIVGELKPTDDGKSLEFTGGGYLQVEHDARLNLSEGFTLEAWIAPGRLPGGGGRLIDKSKAATANGYLLDTYPGNSLRSIVEAGTLGHDAKLAPGQWIHVAATFDPASDRQCLYIGGRLVAERGKKHETESDSSAELSPLTRGYLLQRFINACGGRGAYPIKFNGSIFTVDAVDGGQHYDADYRRWGGCYWFQNTRLPYWAMLYAGDFDLMQPLFRMYRDALPLARERTRKYYGHAGAFFPETMYFWGTYNNANYGWNRQGKPDGLTDNTYIRYYWDGALELLAMMLDYHALTGDARFAAETLVPLAKDTLTFYEEHYPRRDAKGKIVFEPAQALETWHDATNPLPVVAGLHYVSGRLLGEVPVELAGEARAQWQRLRELLPEVPMQTSDGPPRLLPARRFERLANSENPELYAVFPYRLYGLGRPDVEIGRATFDARRVKRTGGWTQDPIQAALLGLTDVAAAYTYQNFSNSHGGSRFPAFWGPNFDWVPDQDHGSVSMIALQRMLMQCDGERILLLPAWPREWNVDFQLHAPQRTTVRAVWRDGKLVTLEVTPQRRLKDVVMPDM